MHRSDTEVVERIERSFLENGYTPVQGAWSDPEASSQRCGLSALLSLREAVCPAAHEIAAQLVGRSDAWVGFFQQAFDAWPVCDQRVFSSEVEDAGGYDDCSRGYRAGWQCARRLFSVAIEEPGIAALHRARRRLIQV